MGVVMSYSWWCLAGVRGSGGLRGESGRGSARGRGRAG